MVAGAQVLFRNFLIWTVAYVPKGPVCDFADEDAVRLVFSGIHRSARRRRSAFLLVEPNLALPGDASEPLMRAGLRPGNSSIQPTATIKIDLRKSDEALLAQMKPKTRYNIRLAQKHGVSVREAGSAADLAVFAGMLRETGERDGFGIHEPGYYTRAWEIFSPPGFATLLIAEQNSEALAGIMVFSCGREAIYMYGASRNERRHLMPNHLLQWEAMRWARQRGCHAYDLWGIPPEARPDEPIESDAKNRKGGLWGVYRFKSGFGGTVVNYPPAYEVAYNRFLHWLWKRSKASA